GSDAQQATILDTGEPVISLSMLHSKIENEEVIDRYVRNQLPLEERQAFEEHFFVCEECFEKLQATERFAAGVRDAAGRGLLNERATNPQRFAWAFAATACAALVLAGLAGWAYLWQLPRLRGELRQTAAQLENGQRSQNHAEQSVRLEQA